MTDTVTKKNAWTPPRMIVGPEGVSRIDFRDCIVDIEQGLVLRYFDKQRSVALRPGRDLDSWEVLGESDVPSGQFWRGIIAFDGSQLLIQQARNALFRVYRTNGEIETQLRISRLIENPTRRETVFLHGQSLDENLDDGSITARWDHKSIQRYPDGEVILRDAEGNEIDPDDELSGDRTVDNPVLDIFARYLAPWQRFAAVNGYTEYVYEGPPGLAEAAPGDPFSIPVAGKPDDIRECVSHDFGDGTILHEYLGRLVAPFIAHEVVTYEGAILSRMVEYDQPKTIMFCDPRGLLRQHDNVIKVEVQYDPEANQYVTCITDLQGDEFIHPKSARFDRGD